MIRWFVGMVAIVLASFYGDLSDALIGLSVLMLYYPETFNKGAK